MKNASQLKWLLSRLRRRIPALAALTAASIATALCGVWFALGTKDVINSAVGGSQTALLRAAVTQAVIICSLLLSVTLQRYLHARLTAQLDRDWKRDLTGKILRSEYAKISNFHSGELINRLNNDVRAVDEGVLTILPSIGSMVTKLIAVVTVLLTLAPVFTVALLAAGALVALATGIARKYLRGLNKAVSAADGKVSGFLQEIFEKLLMVQAMNVEQEVERRGDGLMEERYALQKKRWKITLTANTCISVLGYVSGFAALVWCSFQLAGGSMTFGELTAVTQLVSQLQSPFVHLSGILPKYIAMTAACDRLMELEKACEVEQLQIQDVDYEKLTHIRAEGLSFSYGRDQVFSDCNFSLPKGAFAVITGQSGIGKSTLLKLLLGIFPSDSGTIDFVGENMRISAGRGTKGLFAYVPQGNLLLSGTLRDNLRLTCPDATQEQLQHAVYVSNMDAFLPQLPDGLDTVLGENGHGLSEGQAQRLSIARAVLSGAPILLLDEATSALDEQTENTVLQRLKELPGKTCIAVTHRPGAIALADWKLAVENKKIRCERIGDGE